MFLLVFVAWVAKSIDVQIDSFESRRRKWCFCWWVHDKVSFWNQVHWSYHLPEKNRQHVQTRPTLCLCAQTVNTMLYPQHLINIHKYLSKLGRKKLPTHHIEWEILHTVSWFQTYEPALPKVWFSIGKRWFVETMKPLYTLRMKKVQ